MLTSTRDHLLNNLSLSIISLILGYALWQSMSQPYKIETTFSVPVSFYNTEGRNILAQEDVKVKLYGTRKELYTLVSNLAIHLDAQLYTQKHTKHMLTEKDLFLPDSIVLVHYEPKTIEITIQSF